MNLFFVGSDMLAPATQQPGNRSLAIPWYCKCVFRLEALEALLANRNRTQSEVGQADTEWGSSHCPLGGDLAFSIFLQGIKA